MLLVQKREHLLANQLDQDQKVNIKNVHLKNTEDKERGVTNDNTRNNSKRTQAATSKL